MAENVVVLEPGEERAQRIAKAMASQTAGDILRLIGDGQKTSTEIAEQLAIPMNTAKYHIENLLDAGLISVASTKYSVKGREVKVYSLTNQLLIVAPRQSNVRSLLLKYASLFGIVALGSLVIAALSPLFSYGSVGRSMNGAARTAGASEGAGTVAKAVTDAAAENLTVAPQLVSYSKEAAVLAGQNVTASPSWVPTNAPIYLPPPPEVTQGAPVVTMTPDTALAFFLGGVLVIFVMVCYEVYLWHQMKGR